MCGFVLRKRPQPRSGALYTITVDAVKPAADGRAGVDRSVRSARIAYSLLFMRACTPEENSHDRHHQDARRYREDAHRRPPGRRSAGNDRRTHQARRDHRGAGSHLPRLYRQRAEGDSRPAELQGLSQVDLHLDQPCGLPWHPQREAAEGRRHPQRRHHRHQGRLPRRHQQDVPGRQDRNGPTASARSPRNACTRAFPWCVRRAPGRYRRNHPEARGKERLLGGPRILRPWHRQGVPRGAAGPPLRSCGYRHRAEGRHDLHHRADDQPGPPGDPPARRRLDRDHQDRKLSAQWEHTVLVTADGYEILTLRNDETFPRTSAA